MDVSYTSAVPLLDGRVLFTGAPAPDDASGTMSLPNAALYDPATGKFTPTGPMLAAMAGASATRLIDGRVLFAGGFSSLEVGSPEGSAELFDPATGKFSPTGPMVTHRYQHSATLLADGDVLIVGGVGDLSNALDSAELFDPGTGTFRATGRMTKARIEPTVTTLQDGRVLVAGGASAGDPVPMSSAEIYDPLAGTFAATGSMTTERWHQTATLLPNGRVLMAGGITVGGFLPSGIQVVPPAELYNPASGKFVATGWMTIDRVDHTATLLPNGKVLVVGGTTGSGGSVGFGSGRVMADARASAALIGTTTTKPDGSAELYDPATGKFTRTGSMSTARDRHTATLLPDGRVLIAGGYAAIPPLLSAELYQP
jgi:hypothetical protein